jgi:hypothetical protein
LQNPGVSRRGNAKVCSAVIASEATQSSFRAAKIESWIASSLPLLAMTVKHLGCLKIESDVRTAANAA